MTIAGGGLTSRIFPVVELRVTAWKLLLTLLLRLRRSMLGG
jgi:hypothetical protein